MILTKTNGAAGCMLWGSIQPLVANVFHPSDIVSNPFTLFSFKGSRFLHWALPCHTIRSVTALINSSAAGSSRPSPWERWADPRIQTHQGIDLSCHLIINKFPTQRALLLRPHNENSAGMYEAAWGECQCPDRHAPPLVLSEHVRITLEFLTNYFMDLRIKFALPWDRCHLNLSFRGFHDLRLWMTFPTFMNEMLSFTSLQSVKITGKGTSVQIITRFFRFFGIKLCSFSFLVHFNTFFCTFNSIFL